VHRVITNYPHRFLLCDEVGLGKTIEAGMILKELRARGSAERVLVIVPPNLVRQWQFELKSKFNEPFSILNTDTVRYLQEAHAYSGNPFERYDSVIVSSAWVSQPKWAKLAAESAWDMVIVDEAHHARVRRSGVHREETGLYRVVRDLASPDAFSKRAALFLTATPMQLDAGELYTLIEILDPALFRFSCCFRGSKLALSRCAA
jgi:ATP-dependent helicase HepA